MRSLALALLVASGCTPTLTTSNDAATDSSPSDATTLDTGRADSGSTVDVRDARDAVTPTDTPTDTLGGSTDSGGAVDVQNPPDVVQQGDFQVVVALATDATNVAAGSTLRATVTYRNVGTSPLDVQRIVITARPPGGTHAGGPFDDFAPSPGPITVAPAQDVAVAASRDFTAADPGGTWEIYSTWEDASNTWHDGPSASFSVTASAHPMAPNGYYVVGNTVYDAAGNPHLFHGIDRSTLEVGPTGYMLSADDFMHIASWGAKVVRIALNQDFWLPAAALYDPNYPATVDQVIQWAHAAGMDVILDLHWSDHGDLGNTSPGQQRMADVNSIAFWQSVAARYMNDGRVLYELYNEPHDISWDIWLHGGVTDEGFTAVGMQDLYDAVRGTGAENLVIIGGVQYSYDLSGVPTHRVQGHNIMYNTHPYDWPTEQPSDWMTYWGFLADTDPVIATEFGNSPNSVACSTNYYSELIQFADAHNVSWTAWAWWVGDCTFPPLLADWNGTPNAIGTVVRSALMSYP